MKAVDVQGVQPMQEFLGTMIKLLCLQPLMYVFLVSTLAMWKSGTNAFS